MKRLVSILLALAVCAALAAVVWATSGSVTVVSEPGVDVYGPLSEYKPPYDDEAWGTVKPAVTIWDSRWPTSIPGIWISSANPVEDKEVDSWRWFHDEMTLPCTADNISSGIVVKVHADNAEEFWFNEVMVGSDGEVQGDYYDNAEWNNLKEYLISPHAGVNTLDFIVRNYPPYYPTKDDTYYPNEPNPTGLIYRTTVSYDMPDPVALIAAQDIPVGQVTVWDDGSTLYVEFTTTGGWEIVKTHLHIADSVDGIPQKNGNPIPGKFDYKKESAPWVYEIAVDDLPSGGPLYIAAHAVVQKVLGGAPYYASSVYASAQGSRKDGSPVLPERSNPDQGLMLEQNKQATDFFSLGFGGELVVEFDCPIRNGEGDDVGVWEDTWGTYPSETAEVYASQDGANWYFLGTADNSNQANTWTLSKFDLGDLAWAKYIKVVDTTDPTPHDSSADGFDVNAVVALQDCLQEETAWGDGNDFDGKNWATYFTVPYGCE